jgi:hypothetical protein
MANRLSRSTYATHGELDRSPTCARRPGTRALQVSSRHRESTWRRCKPWRHRAAWDGVGLCSIAHYYVNMTCANGSTSGVALPHGPLHPIDYALAERRGGEPTSSRSSIAHPYHRLTEMGPASPRLQAGDAWPARSATFSPLGEDRLVGPLPPCPPSRRVGRPAASRCHGEKRRRIVDGCAPRERGPAPPRRPAMESMSTRFGAEPSGRRGVGRADAPRSSRL